MFGEPSRNLRVFCMLGSSLESKVQARNQLGHQGGAKSFLRVAQIFESMSNTFKLCPTYFYRWCEKILGGALPLRPPPGCGPGNVEIAIDLNKSYVLTATHQKVT